ncbi:hypothetical protein FP435_03060 [Lactobacillus sp. PV037]|uniref:hypothetical protein n=1 Tax=unclassified Lactobacillus TaxID=2620435 RepID=UPI00223F0376|nr:MULTISPECIES: hypothetical protein [unclassified Lactobacillus]QNQ82395.1 hypothetical protein FP433_04765 [Lactobacillus sp. PV012]QNQ83491.1 hypothetical protein FP435_03060 [Lactobacillus sp. PV037]
MFSLNYQEQIYLAFGLALGAIFLAIVFTSYAVKSKRKLALSGGIVLLLIALGSGYQGWQSFNKLHESLPHATLSETRSSFFDVVAKPEDYNGENYQFKTDQAGDYTLKLKGLRVGEVKVLSGNKTGFNHLIRTVSVEPNKVTKISFSLPASQQELFLNLEDSHRTVDVITIFNNSTAYRQHVKKQSNLLPGKKINLNLVEKRKQFYVNKELPQISYLVKKGKISELRYQSNNLLLDPKDSLECIQKIWNENNLQFTKQRKTINQFNPTFKQNFNFYSKRCRQWFQVRNYLKDGKLKYFTIKSGLNAEYS